MKKPLIGITPAYNTTKMQYDLPPSYTNAIIKSGGIPVILPYTSDPEIMQQLVDTCDGFLYSGGHDVAPWVYGADPWYGLDILAPLRDMTEVALFKPAFASKKPMFGICRGMQMINCCLGGTLYQDLPTDYVKPEEILHCQKEIPVKPTHGVQIVSGSPLEKIAGLTEIQVNSFHHQAVKDLGKGLQVTATASDGMIESAYLPDHPYLCLVQWHPEELFPHCKVSQALFEHFVKACAK